MGTTANLKFYVEILELSQVLKSFRTCFKTRLYLSKFLGRIFKTIQNLQYYTGFLH
ncbi:hypothetical protein LEP1GSC021_1463 [Leptospira noguchii str. 1993005606]|uniref:Uncharacterized protein n=1 Tax=Leptospira noguchii str. 2007001578 TaxID=1049974 RepID=A0ABN0IZH3_9LEPT|nr:hypothetical protein LEP1GSC035_3508 [Leptospira noguchii str. 2007001578]EPE83043.1 hypothetical protein LEP1GSC021_1463 [Leptospira noguchii str. 1993005606]